jgi:DNA helicase-2/ATP-dependent DNA helicase PcrA
MAPSDLITWLITELNYVDYLKDTYKEDSEVQSRIENLMELVNVASEYDNIEDLLVQASLYREDLEDKEDAVQLMTMHKSKGLQNKAVICIGLAEGIAPHFKALEDPKQIEEERRLCYVTMTRAEDYLFMTYPSMVKIQGRDSYAAPSRFLKEIDSKYTYKN